MLDVVSFIIASQWVVNKRSAKPFISLLGETYELVTDKFKFLSEHVKSNPSVTAMHCQGEKFCVTG